METVAFVQGMFTAIGILLSVGIVWAVLKINKLKSELKDVYTELTSLQRDLHLRIDEESKEINTIIDDIYRSVDSRFDKFLNSSKKMLNG